MPSSMKRPSSIESGDRTFRGFSIKDCINLSRLKQLFRTIRQFGHMPSDGGYEMSGGISIGNKLQARCGTHMIFVGAGAIAGVWQLTGIHYLPQLAYRRERAVTGHRPVGRNDKMRRRIEMAIDGMITDNLTPIRADVVSAGEIIRIG